MAGILRVALGRLRTRTIGFAAGFPDVAEFQQRSSAIRTRPYVQTSWPNSLNGDNGLTR